MNIQKISIIEDPQNLYRDGMFVFPEDRFDSTLWAAKIVGLGYSSIFERNFLVKKRDDSDHLYYFKAPEDGIYQIKADMDKHVINEFIEIKNGKPELVNFSYVKQQAYKMDQDDIQRRIDSLLGVQNED